MAHKIFFLTVTERQTKNTQRNSLTSFFLFYYFFFFFSAFDFDTCYESVNYYTLDPKNKQKINNFYTFDPYLVLDNNKHIVRSEFDLQYETWEKVGNYFDQSTRPKIYKMIEHITPIFDPISKKKEIALICAPLKSKKSLFRKMENEFNNNGKKKQIHSFLENGKYQKYFKSLDNISDMVRYSLIMTDIASPAPEIKLLNIEDGFYFYQEKSFLYETDKIRTKLDFVLYMAEFLFNQITETKDRLTGDNMLNTKGYCDILIKGQSYIPIEINTDKLIPEYKSANIKCFYLGIELQIHLASIFTVKAIDHYFYEITRVVSLANIKTDEKPRSLVDLLKSMSKDELTSFMYAVHKILTYTSEWTASLKGILDLTDLKNSLKMIYAFKNSHFINVKLDAYIPQILKGREDLGEIIYGEAKKEIGVNNPVQKKCLQAIMDCTDSATGFLKNSCFEPKAAELIKSHFLGINMIKINKI